MRNALIDNKIKKNHFSCLSSDQSFILNTVFFKLFNNKKNQKSKTILKKLF